MKLINLTVRGINDRKETYDFGNRIVGCSMMQDADKNALRCALAFALYGKRPEGAELPVSAELGLSVEDAEYTVIRDIDTAEDGTAISETVVIGSDGKRVAEGEEAVALFVSERVGLKEEEFEKLFEISPDFTAPVASDTITRESFIAEKLAELATSAEVIARGEGLVRAEQAIYEEIDDIEPVTRDSLKEQHMIVENDRLSLESLRKEIEAVNNEIGLASKYQEELTKYYEATAKMDALKAKEGEMSAMAEKASRSEAAKGVASVFAKYTETNERLEAMTNELKAGDAECEALAKRVEDGKKSEKMVAEGFIEAFKRKEELEKAMREIATEGSATPSAVKVKSTVDSYYAEFEGEIAELTKKLAELTATRDALVSACADLTDRKLAIRDNPDYKKAVQDGAVYESAIKVDTEHLKSAESRIEILQEKRAKLLDDNTANVESIKVLNAEIRDLGSKIRGGYKSIEDAVNADAVNKQALYADHLFVSENEVQLDAVVKKIEKVEATKHGYAEKLAKLTAKRDEVAAHRNRLSEKLKLLNEKMTEYMSQNRLRDMSSEIEYGSRCPVCDGFVTYKKDLPLRDTKALDDQIKAVEAELAKDTDALLNAESAIGQYKAATTVSAQYLESLIATRDDKQRSIDNILAKYGAKDIPELFKMVRDAVEASNVLTRNIDVFRKKDAEVRRLGVVNNIVIERIKDIDENALPTEKKIAESLAKHIDMCTRELLKLDSYFNGESPVALLKKLQVVEREYATLEVELEEKEAKLADTEAEIRRTEERLHSLTARTVTVDVDGVELASAEVVAKAYSDYLLAIYEEIDKCEEVKAGAKVRILAIKKIVADAQKAYDEKREALVALSSTIEATRETASAIYGEYEERFAELGIRTQADVDRLVLDEDVMDKYREVLYKYDEDVAGTKEAINLYNTGITEHVGYYDNYEKNVAYLKELQKKEEESVVALGKSVITLNDMEDRYARLLELNRKLTTLQARIEALDELKSAVKDGAIIAGDLAKVITERAKSIAKTMSKERYVIELNGEGAYELRSVGKNKVRADKLTKEESVIVPYATAFAYNEVMVALLAGDIVPEVEISATICDKASLAPIMEYAKERDVVVIPDDETAFFRAVSKIAL